ncbi:MAG: PAS domain-containing protein [Candidatus Cloacimonetes bacterium]|nr:PAS domain-containing protein [Candidatus Cloacimonadota bacterium]
MKESIKTNGQLVIELAKLRKQMQNIEHEKSIVDQTHNELTKNNEMMNAILTNADFHIWVYDGKQYLYLNEEWYCYTGQNRNRTPTIDCWFEMLHPDDQERAIKNWEKNWKSKTEFEDVFRLKSATGIYRTFNSHAYPVFNKKGNFQYFQGFNIDITDNLKMKNAVQNKIFALSGSDYHEKKIKITGELNYDKKVHPVEIKKRSNRITKQKGDKQSHDFLNNVINSLPHPFYVINTNDYTIEKANSASTIKNEQRKYKCYSVIFNKHRRCKDEERSCPLRIVQKTGKSTIVEHIHPTLDGNYKIAEVHTHPIFDEKGEVVQIIQYSLDITQRKKAEKDLLTSREHLQFINSILRHDLTNNLAAINSGIRLFKDSEDKNYLTEISKKIKESVNLIGKLKGFEDKLFTESSYKSMNLRRILQKCVKSYLFMKIQIKGDGNVLANDALSSVFDNIIGNAVIHSKTDKIDINIKPNGRYYGIDICDYGIGIPDRIKERIFEKNFKYGKSGNTGLGLYLTKKMMEKYDGKISISDNSPTGTIFKLKLNKA